jgi:hypothetical protein
MRKYLEEEQMALTLTFAKSILATGHNTNYLGMQNDA